MPLFDRFAGLTNVKTVAKRMTITAGCFRAVFVLTGSSISSLNIPVASEPHEFDDS